MSLRKEKMSMSASWTLEHPFVTEIGEVEVLYMQNKDIDPFKAAIIQHSPIFLNIGLGIEKACKLIREAASKGAKVIAFPETWLPG